MSFSNQFIIERWADGLKVLGAGNGAGFLAAVAGIQYFSTQPEFLFVIKVGAALFLAGIFLFAMAYCILTMLPLAILRFVESSGKSYSTFSETIEAFAKKKRQNAIIYIMFVVTSLSSFVCFILGCLQAVQAFHFS